MARTLADLAKASEGEDGQAADLAALLNRAEARALLAGTFGNSPFLSRVAVRDALHLPAMFDGDPASVLRDIIEETRRAGDEAPGMDALMRSLRQARRRAALLIALADLSGAWGIEEVTEGLTAFAEAAITASVRWLLRKAAASGEIELADPAVPEHESGLIVIGMGKLGARELNYSSDVDLIVFFAEERVRYTGQKTAQACFIRLVQDMVKILQSPTGDGFVLRVDLRLRPDPGATPVVITTTAAEQYYESMGQNWERAAMIKARLVAGDPVAGADFLRHLEPFIWRRNLDYAAIEDVHSIKRQIHSHRGHASIAIEGHNIKVGRGGIRDIEFFAQTQQLIAGGREPALRSPRTCEAIEALAAAGWIRRSVAEEMVEAYRSHRTLEHRLQMIADEQTQNLPKTPDGIDHVARFSGYAETADFRRELLGTLGRVEKHYANLFEQEPSLAAGGNLVFTGAEDDPDTLATLREMGFGEPQGVSATIRGWHHGRYRATRTARSRELLTKIMPTLLHELADTPSPSATFGRFDRFLSGLPAGVQLFSMMAAQPKLLTLLAKVMGSAPRLADYLSRNASVLDAVLSEDFFEAMPGREELEPGFAQAMRLTRDYQDVLEVARRWVKERKFQLGVQALTGEAEVDVICRGLTDVAEVAVTGLYPKVAAEFAGREGHGSIAGAGMAMIAMGKFGSAEMTETSDLDLIFVYDYPDEEARSDGASPLPAPQYFGRLSQRLINAITAQTAEGRLYEVDMRLRPSGNAGPVATRLGGFAQYQESEAWTWEHMALTRARVIAGPDALREAVQKVIRQALCRPRDSAKVAEDVCSMRRRILTDKGGKDPWDLKLARGGLLDIEFIAQCLQLVHAARYPETLDPNTCSALGRLADAGALDRAMADELIGASRLFRTIMGLVRVALSGDFDPANLPEGLRGTLFKATGTKGQEELEERVLAAEARVVAAFDHLVGPV